jgi:hypothetical protein
MHPRTVAILTASILLLALGMRVVVYQTGLLPVSEELILKQATALTVAYVSGGKLKSLTISQPEQLQELFAVLDLRHDTNRRDEILAVNGPGPPFGGTGQVTFHFPDRSTRQMYFRGPNWLEDREVNPRFYAKLCEYVSRAEGRPVQLLRDNLWPPGGDVAP